VGRITQSYDRLQTIQKQGACLLRRRWFEQLVALQQVFDEPSPHIELSNVYGDKRASKFM